MYKIILILVCSAVFGCGATTANLSGKVSGKACELGCDQTRDKCVSECAPPTAQKESGPQEVSKEDWTKKQACEMACQAAREKCMDRCQNG